jgi:dTDP-4-dehydrorhamnose 3,5-epimerase
MTMVKVTPTELPEILVLEPRVFRDERGAFFETWKESTYRGVGVALAFVQDNVSHSVRGTLRGLHFQEPTAQGKLVQVLSGAVWDVAVDVRRGSPTHGRWVGLELDGENARQLWIPPGFAHGFYVLSERATFLYKCTAPYAPTHERSIRWDDPALAIRWPIPSGQRPLVSPKDGAAPTLADSETLPQYRA